jgi:hypothetical protein
VTAWDESSETTEDDGAGYRQRSKTSRFTKGRGGNPAGRPLGRHGQAPYEAVLGQMVTPSVKPEPCSQVAASSLDLWLPKDIFK